ncbi:MAG: CPBP family glutamic-type intramembrane protease [Desulfitobacteriaceae bacterium]
MTSKYYSVFTIVVSVILAPIVEESLCRGIFLYKFSFKRNIKWGIIISSLITLDSLPDFFHTTALYGKLLLSDHSSHNC